MYLDSKRTEITVNLLANSVKDMKKQNKKLWTENYSIKKRNEELVTKRSACIRPCSGRAKIYKLFASLTRIFYGLRTDLGKDIIPWAPTVWCHVYRVARHTHFNCLGASCAFLWHTAGRGRVPPSTLLPDFGMAVHETRVDRLREILAGFLI